MREVCRSDGEDFGRGKPLVGCRDRFFFNRFKRKPKCSQAQNREKALEVLRSKIYQMMQEQQKSSVDQLRREQVGSAERSEKIRTWNFPQDRITNHRFGVSVGNLEAVLDGGLSPLLEKIQKNR